MSLINQMLKDIDQRGKTDDVNSGASSRYVATDRPRPAWVYLVFGLVASVLFALAILWWLAPESPVESEVETVALVPAPEESVAQSAPVITPPAARNVQPVRTLPQTAEPEPTVTETAEPSVQETAVEEPVAQEPAATEPSMSIARSSATPRELAQRHYDQGMALLGQGQTRQGATKLQEALLLAPEFHEAREELAVYYFTRGFLSDALQVLERGLEQFPGEPRLLLLQARMLERSGQQALALELVREVPARFPQHADIFMLRGALAEQLEDYELAVSTYEALLAWRGDQGTWWLGLALSYDALQNDAAAIRAYEGALGDPTLATASRNFVTERLEALR